jgi:hypothetical protein
MVSFASVKTVMWSWYGTYNNIQSTEICFLSYIFVTTVLSCFYNAVYFENIPVQNFFEGLKFQ